MTLARELIDSDADKVVRRLARRGHQAYLVGGCVRDLLLGRTPKDFDVATSATPNEIKHLFRNCRIIGRRFRLAHIFFGGKIIETATFRANPRHDDDDDELLIRRDNVFGSDTEDARRRDFTINGLFYDVETEQVVDHVDGLADLEARVISTIGDPEIRFCEDPVRMLRAIKFAARLDFTIAPATRLALTTHRAEIRKCAPPRVLEELYRMLRGTAARRSMELLIELGMARILSPALLALFDAGEPEVADASPADPDPMLADQPSAADQSSEEAAWAAVWADVAAVPPPPTSPPRDDAEEGDRSDTRAQAWKVLDQIDLLAREGTPLSNTLLLTALVHPFVIETLLGPGTRPVDASAAVDEILQPLLDELNIARRDGERTRQVLLAQRRLAPSRRRRGRPLALVRRDYFDDSLALYELTALAAGRDTDDVDRWRQIKSEGSRDQRGRPEDEDQPKKTRRRRRGGRRRRRSDDERRPPADP